MKSLTFIDIHIGQQLKKRRQYMNFTQTDLATKIGLTSQQIHKYEKGRDRIAASRLFQFSILLDVPFSYFYEGLQEAAPFPKKVKIQCFTSPGISFTLHLDNTSGLFSTIRLITYS